MLLQGRNYRFSVSAPTDSPIPIGKEIILARVARFALNADKLTETAMTDLKEH